MLLAKPNVIPDETLAELRRLAPSRVYILGGTAALSAEVEAQAAAITEKVVRLAGEDRYDTSVVISQSLWSRAGVVYIASGAQFPDALSGGALAAKQRAPMLLTAPDELPAAVRAELNRLSPHRVVVLGGTTVVSAAVQTQIAQAAPGAAVSRLSGGNRYKTSAVIAEAGWRQSDAAFFAAGSDFPDALAGVPVAALHGAPLLLTKETCLPRAVGTTANKLNPTDRVLLGGTSVLQDSASSATC